MRTAGRRAVAGSAHAIENVNAVAETVITGPIVTNVAPPPPADRYVRRLRRSSWSFAAGALLFTVGAMMSLLALADTVVINSTYAVGAVVFTTGAYIQLDLSGRRRPTRRTNLADRADWWSAAVQLAGTLFFNVSTALALGVSLGDVPSDVDGWRPDAAGSAAFLVSSALAAIATTQRTHLWDPLARTWRSMWLNALGSIAFAISAVLSFPAAFAGLHVFDATWTTDLSLVGTAIGGVCFFFGAILARRTVRVAVRQAPASAGEPGAAGA